MEPSRADGQRRPEVLRIDPPKIDFGQIMQGDFVSRTVSIRNISGRKVALNLGKSCGCTSIQALKSELDPGVATDVHVTLDTSTKSGPFKEAVYISTAEYEGLSSVVEVVGSVVTALQITPDRISFGELRHRSAAKASVELHSLDKKPLSILTVTALENSVVTETCQISSNQAVVTVRLPDDAKPGAIRDVVQIALQSPFERTVEILVTGFYTGNLSAEPPILTWCRDTDEKSMDMVLETELAHFDGLPFAIKHAACSDKRFLVSVEPVSTLNGIKLPGTYVLKVRPAEPVAEAEVHALVTVDTDIPEDGRLEIPVKIARKKQENL